MMLLADGIAVVIVMIVVMDVGLLSVAMRMARTVVGRINWCLGLTIIMTRSGAMTGMTSTMDKGRCSQVGNPV